MSNLKYYILLVITLISLHSYGQENGLSFDGVDDFVSFASAPSLDGGSTKTFEAWLYPTRVTGFNTVASWTDGVDNLINFSIANGFLDLSQNDGVQTGNVTGSIAINPNEWTHIAFVMTAGSADFYVNGVQENVGSGAASAGICNNFTLGIFNNSFSPYEGIIDEVRIWNEALDQATIDSRRNMPLTGAETNLAAYYQFNESAGTVLPDLTANAYDGALQNGATNTPPADGLTDGPIWVASSALPPQPSLSYTSSPTPNAISVSQTSTITLDFDADIDLSSVHNNTTNGNEVYDDNIHITGSESGRLEGTITVGGDNSIIVFTPSASYKSGEKITVAVTNSVLGSSAEVAYAKSFSFIVATGPYEGSFKSVPNPGLAGISYGASDWGDYDNDGDIDLIFTGFDPTYTPIATIYQNNGGVFSDISAGLTGVFDSDCKWGDYDGDGDLDLIVAGLDDTYTTRRTTIYQNNSGIFTDIGAGLEGVDFASVDWGDYDSDGDLDLIVAGRYFFGSPDLSSTKIYQNNGGVFTDINAGLIGLNRGSVDWGDYDADGDLDLLVTGFDDVTPTPNRYLIVYRNDDGSFVDIGAGLPGFGYSATDWGDYDNDGDLDIAVLGGKTVGTDGTFIYQNNGGIFTDISAALPDDLEEGSIDWGDYDGDGDLDLLLTGMDYSPSDNITTAIYDNNGGSFTNINAGMEGVAFRSVGSWGDYDNDGDLDLVAAGEDYFGDIIVRLYENTVFNPFVTTWQTDNPGDSNNDQITIPTTGSGYNYDIYWEEVGNPTNNGTEPAGQTGDYTITFPTPGTYRVEISGNFPRIYFNAASFNPDKDSEKLLTVEQWGDVAWTSMAGAFSGCVNFTIKALDAPNLSAATSMQEMFYEAASMNADINHWDVSTITNMNGLFRDALIFNQPLDNWSVSNVLDMSYMFFWAKAFNQPIGNWDVSSVTNMNLMFAGCDVFNQNIGGWNVSSVTNTNQMFSNALVFNQDISSWDMTNVTNIRSMFSGALVFNQNISVWDITSATDISAMFRNAAAFNQDISGWDVSAVTDMAELFNGAIAFNQDLSLWNVSSVQDMRSMFAFTTYNQDITGWNVGLVQDFNGMFEGNTAFNQDISGWDVSSATDMRQMFRSASSFDQDLGGWNVSNLRFAVNMLNNSGMSVENYDNLLLGWLSLPLQSNVSFGAQNVFYCNGFEARSTIISSFNWFITDAGLGCIAVYDGPDTTAPEVINGQVEPIDMGSGELGVGKSRSFTMENRLGVTLNNIAITLFTGTEFSITLPATTLAAGATLTFDVNLLGNTNGSHSETISIISDEFIAPFVFNVTAEVTAGPEPEIVVYEGSGVLGNVITDGDAIGFGMGSEERGTDLLGYITIANIGSANLDISAFSFGGTSFTLDTNAPLTIIPDASQVIQITLDGTLGIDHTDVLEITSNDTDETVYDFPVLGSILGPEIRVFNGPDRFYPDILSGQATPTDLGASNVGTDLVAQLTITNYGPIDLDISSLMVTGTAFTINPLPPVILAGEFDGIYDSWVIDVTLDGSAKGVFTETVTISSDDDVTPVFTFDITGSIVEPPHIYWTENIGDSFDDDEIHRTDLDGNDFSRYYSGFADRISGLVIDTAANRLYWTDAAQAEIIFGEIGAGGLSSGPTKIVDYNPSSAGDLVDLAIDVANSHIYFTYGNAETGFFNKIARVDTDGNNLIELIDLGSEVPFGIDLDLNNNKIYFTTNIAASGYTARLYRSDLDGNNLEELHVIGTSFPPTLFRDVKIDHTNDIVYWSTGEEDQPSTIYYNSTADAAPFAAPASFGSTGEVWGLDLDPINNKLYWMCRGSNDGTTPAAVMRADLDGSNPEGVFVVTLYPPSYPPGPAGSSFIALDLRGATLPVCATPPTADAGIDQSICEADIVTLAANIGGGASSLTWSTGGDGTFDDPSSATAQYTPGANDISLGSVTLTLTTDDPDGSGPCLAATDNIIITINPQPTVSVDTDFAICEGDVANLNGSIAGSATTITWTSSGDGSFDNNASLTPIYTPGASDISSGSVTITATTDDPDGAGSCLAATASLVLTIDPAPTVDAGADQSICTGDAVSLTGVLGGSAISATWTTNGDGSFDNATNLNATYTPGTTDIANGTVSLSLASDPTTTCLIITDVLTITINQPIIVIDQTASQNAGVTTVIDVTNGSTINTGDVLTTTIVTSPLKGTAVVNADGSISYTSNQGNVGSDSFDFQVCNQCGLCDQATATITINNEPPVSNIPPAAGQAGGILTINVLDGITDVNGNIDLSSFKVIIQPTSGASASFDQDGNLIVDYTGINFVGTDELTIEVCDFDGLCVSQVVTIEIAVPPITVFNAVSPNNDGKHDYLEIENITVYSNNRVLIMNRWGDIVFDARGYDNQSVRFEGRANKGAEGELPPGTYYYQVDLGDKTPVINGFFTLRR